MKKKTLLVAVALFGCVSLGTGLACSSQSSIVYATDSETTETTEITSESEISSEIIVESENESESGVYDTISQTAQDTIAVVTAFLNQPIVIAGVSTTVGALLLLVIGKLLGNVTTKKIKQLSSEKENLSNKIVEQQAIINDLVNTTKLLQEIVNEVVNNIKNGSVKKNCLALLEQCKDGAIEKVAETLESELQETNEDKVRF